MQLTFFKSLFSKLSTLYESIQYTFESEERKASKNPLYQSFNLYTKEDFKLALDLLKNGYVPTKLQSMTLKNTLIENSKINPNFLYNCSNYLEFVPTESIVSFCLHNDLSKMCKNELTVFNNFQHIFQQFSDKEQFADTLYFQLKSSIFTNAVKAAAIKPKYPYTLDLDVEDKKTCAILRFSIYNSLVLIPFMIKTMDEFVSLKTTIEQSVSKVGKLVQEHNYNIKISAKKSIHTNPHNRALFYMDTLENWVEYIQKYDTTALQTVLFSKIKEQKNSSDKNISIEENTSDSSISKESPISSQNMLIEARINELKIKLNPVAQTQVEIIQTLHSQIKSEIFEPLKHHELDSLYKDLPNVMEKFISIHPEYRTSLRSVEGKTPEQLMLDSLDMIESKFTLYWEDINQNKVTDLSIAQRTIKMKA